jgi:ribosomal protein L11 methyltransferase
MTPMADRPIVVQLEVAGEDAELAADALWQAGPSAVLEVDLGDGRVRLTADVADPALVASHWCPIVLRVDDDGYLDAWRTWAAPVRAGRHVVLRPAWVPVNIVDSRLGDLVVVLDPGRSFGSGSHETTRLAIALLEDAVTPGDRVLDVGCGSGVLSVVAALLGAAEVVAIDVEDDAVLTTEANAAANEVGGRVSASTTALTDLAVEPGFDVVVANIGGGVLPTLAPALSARTAPGGSLLVTGLLAEQLTPVVASLGPGWGVRARQREGAWVGAHLAPAGS